MAQGALPFSFLDLFVPGASAMAQFGTQAAQRGVEVEVRPAPGPAQPSPRAQNEAARAEWQAKRQGPRTRAGKVVEEAKKGEMKPGEEKGEKGAEKLTLGEKAKKAAPIVGATLGVGAALYFVGKAVLRG